jgi:hypothetical protein
MLFQKSNRRAAFTACGNRSEQIIRSFKAMGLAAYQDNSRVSASAYVCVYRNDDDDDDPVKIRISDHDDCYGGNDMHVYADKRAAREVGGIAWYEAVARIAGMYALPVPAAAKAAATRARKTAETEASHLAKMKSEIADRDRKIRALYELRRSHDPDGYVVVQAMSGKKGRTKRSAWRKRIDAELIDLGHKITNPVYGQAYLED